MTAVLYSSSSGLCMGDCGERYMTDGIYIKGGYLIFGLVAGVITLNRGGSRQCRIMANDPQKEKSTFK